MSAPRSGSSSKTPRAPSAARANGAASATAAPSRAELEQHRAGSRRRGRHALLALVLALGALLWGRYRMLALVASEKAAGRPASGLDLAQIDPLGFALFWGGLLVAFGSTLLAVLSMLHAKHVERGLATLEREDA